MGAVAIVASAGGIPALIELLRGLNRPSPFPVIIAQHLARFAPSILPSILRWHTGRSVKWATQDESPTIGMVYVVPPRCAVEVRDFRFVLKQLPEDARSWLGVPDLLFHSLSNTYGSAAIGVTLSGALAVGVTGLRAIVDGGGTTMAQDEATSGHFAMPRAAIDLGRSDIIFPPHRIALALNVLAEQRAALSA